MYALHVTFVVVVVALLLSSCSAALPWLRQSGTHIVDENNNTVYLRGVNLGGWLEWEGWMWGAGPSGTAGYISHTVIFNAIANVVGYDAAYQFQTDVYNTMITEADFQAMHSMGINSVRLNFNFRILMNLSEPYVWLESGWQIFDNVVNWAESNSIYVIFDLHGAPASQGGNGFIYDPPPGQGLFYNKPAQNQTVYLWQAIAERYANRSSVLGYDILNEPWPLTSAQLVSMYSSIIAAIRQVDSKHIIVLEGSTTARSFTWVGSTNLDPNMMYSFHMYLWLETNASKQLATYTSLAQQMNAPMWCGEWGENTISNLNTEGSMFFNQPDTISGWAFWSWKKTNNGFAYLVEIPAPANWVTFASEFYNLGVNASYPSPLSPSDAKIAMQQFLQALVFNSSNINPAMIPVVTQPAGKTNKQ